MKQPDTRNNEEIGKDRGNKEGTKYAVEYRTKDRTFKWKSLTQLIGEKQLDHDSRENYLRSADRLRGANHRKEGMRFLD